MTIPSELQRSGPRHVTLTARGWWRFVGFLANIAIIVAIFVFQGVRNSGQTSHPAPYRSVTATAMAPGTTSWWIWRGIATLIVACTIYLLALRRHRRILMNGRATMGHIIGEVTPWWFRLRNRRRRPRRLECEFPLLSGGVCRTTVETRDTPPAPNAEVVIVYDPDQPAKAVLYPAWFLKIDRT